MTHESPLPPFGHGLDLRAALEVSALPREMRAALRQSRPDEPDFRQMLIVAHAGRAFWQSLTASGIQSEDPVDDFTLRVIETWLATHLPGVRHRVLYPRGDCPLSLRALGALVGWHHASPFRIGILPEWGTWFAYRAVVLADSDFMPTVPVALESPCTACAQRVCVSRCPAGALTGDALDLQRCIAYRRLPGSPCRETCLARTSCPVGAEHRYTDEQLHYHYGRSMRSIEATPPAEPEALLAAPAKSKL
ncbi:MAG: hypothetical protein H5U40_13505 [Polyangiaceae bacterium]|nr:hypothetical protein [Polyangiaceae bacterium]